MTSYRFSYLHYPPLPSPCVGTSVEHTDRLSGLDSAYWARMSDYVTTNAQQSAQTRRCLHVTIASNLPTSSALRQMQRSFSAASASTKSPTPRSASIACSACVPCLTSSSGMRSTSSGRRVRHAVCHTCCPVLVELSSGMSSTSMGQRV
jgi:biotin carboxylase